MNLRASTFIARFFTAAALLLAFSCSVSPEFTFDAGTDFQLRLSSNQVVVPQGGQGNLGVQVNWLGDCGCPDVQLAVTGAPDGLSTRFDANPTAVGTTLFLNPTSQLPAGLYRLVVTGLRGTLLRSQVLDVQVVAPNPDFSVALNPAFLTVGQGGSATLGIDIQRTGGFSEAVSLSLAGAPAGVSATFSGTPLGAHHAAVPGPATLLLTLSPSAPAGSHLLTVNAAASSRLRSATFILSIQPVGDFTLALAPATLTVPAGTGSAGPVTATLTRAPGFTAAVAFALESAPVGCTGLFTPASTTGTSATLGLTLAGLAPGSYPLTVRGSSGSLSHTATLLLTVTAPPPDFSLPPVAVSAVVGGTGSAALVISPINGFSAPVTLSAAGLPVGVTTTFTPNPATPSSGSSLGVTVPASLAPGSYSGTLRGVSGSLDHSSALTLQVNPAGDFALSLLPSPNLNVQVPRGGSSTGTATAQIQPSGGFSGPVTFSAENLPAGVTATFSPNPATSSAMLSVVVSPLAVPGTYPVTVRGISGILDRTTPLNLTLAPPVDVAITLSPAAGSATIPGTGTTLLNTAVGLTPVNGFSGSVALAARDLPTGVSAAFSPNSVGVPGSSTLTFTITPAAVAGTTTVTVEATQGPLTASASYALTLIVPTAPDFTVTPQLPAVTEQPGTSGTMLVTVASVNGFAGPVAMSFQNAPAGMSGVLSPNPVVVPSGGSATTTLYLTTGATVAGGVYATRIRGAAGPLVHDAAWPVTVQDFTLAATPNAFSFPSGTGISGGGSLAITRLHGLTNPISFSASLPGFSFVFTPPSTSGNSAAFSFTGPALAAAPAGVYPALVTGNAGSFSRTTPVTLTVQGFLMTLMPCETASTGAIPPIAIQTTPVGAVTGSASIVMVPSGLYSAGFAPMPVTLGSSCTWTLTPTTTPGPGIVTLTVNGAAGVHTATRSLTQHITFAPDYYIHTTDAGGVTKVSVVAVAAGGTATLRVFLNAVSGFTGAPALTLSGAPAGLGAAFSPAILGGSPSTLTLSAAAGLTPGFYWVDVVASASPLSRKATLLVIVS